MPHQNPPTYSIITVVHNARAIVQMSTLRILRHSAKHDARLIVFDNASDDGVQLWLRDLEQRGDIHLMRSETQCDDGEAIEIARREVRSPYLVTLDSHAYPISDDWLPTLHQRLMGDVKVTGIVDSHGLIHPSCMMIAMETLSDFNLSFLGKAGDKICAEIKRRGYQIEGLAQVDVPNFGLTHGGVIWHQCTKNMPQATRTQEQIIEAFHAEPREITVAVGIGETSKAPERVRNVKACLRSLNLQDFPRWRYRVVVVEQNASPQLESELAPLADCYVFAYNPDAYNAAWGRNIGACNPIAKTGAICLVDADLLAPANFLRESFPTIQPETQALLPSKVLWLDESSTERALSDRWAQPLTTLDPDNYSGVTSGFGVCMWVDAALYHELGGQDERFRGWGEEDMEFCNRLRQVTRLGHFPMPIFHLHHPPASGKYHWRNYYIRMHLSSMPLARPRKQIGRLDLYAHEADS